MQVNKTKVRTAKEKKINNNQKSRNKTCFKTETFTMKKRALLFFYYY